MIVKGSIFFIYYNLKKSKKKKKNIIFVKYHQIHENFKGDNFISPHHKQHNNLQEQIQVNFP